MDFRSQYQSELDYLLEVGRDFSRVHTQASHLAERSGDPDVERLLEGFAFLTAKIHARLDNAQPLLAQSLSQFLAPQHLAPVPACTVVEFRPDFDSAQKLDEIPTGTTLSTRAVQGTKLSFETTRSIDIIPLRIVHAQVRSNGASNAQLVLDLETNEQGRPLVGQLGQLDLYIHGEPAAATDTVMALARHCTRVSIYDFENAPEASRPEHEAKRRLLLPSPKLELSGFSDRDPLLPWGEQALVSHRLLAEYQTLPEKFRQIRLHGLHPLKLQDNRIRIIFDLNCATDVPGQVAKENIRLFVTPARNVFHVAADPLHVHALDRPQRIRAATSDLSHFEVYDVESVDRIPQGSKSHEAIPSFFAFEAGPPSATQLRYSLERRNSPIDQHVDTYLRLHSASKRHATSRDTISMRLRCTNRRLPEELKIGDVSVAPHGARRLPPFSNLTAPTAPCAPPLAAELQWRLHASIALNRSALTDSNHLRTLFALYNHQSRLRNAQGLSNEHLAKAVRSASAHPITRIIKGAPVRGIQSRIEVDRRNLSEGQAYLLGALLNEILAAHTCLNSIHETKVCLYPSGHDLAWKPRSGDRVLGA